jgi:hypothetical protein
VRGPAGKVAYRRRTPTTPSLRRCQTERYGPTSVQKARRRVLHSFSEGESLRRRKLAKVASSCGKQAMHERRRENSTFLCVLDDYDVQANMARASHLEGASTLVRLADRSNSLPDVSIPNR